MVLYCMVLPGSTALQLYLYHTALREIRNVLNPTFGFSLISTYLQGSLATRTRWTVLISAVPSTQSEAYNVRASPHMGYGFAFRGEESSSESVVPRPGGEMAGTRHGIARSI